MFVFFLFSFCSFLSVLFSLLLYLCTWYLIHVLLLSRYSLLSKDLQIGAHVLTFHRDDFHVLFSPFLKSVPTDLQMEKSVVETNRCFFLHLGVAMGLHPYALQVFRTLHCLYLTCCFRPTAAADDNYGT